MSDNVAATRCVVFLAGAGAGQTSLCEAVLFNAKAIDRLGKVDDGNTAMDFEPEEIKRHTSISAAVHHYDYKKHRVFIMDTPGDSNFMSDTKAAASVADGAVVVIDAVDGVKVQTETAWAFAERFGLPRLIFINKMDRERADFQATLADIEKSLETRTVALQIPIGEAESFSGVIDLLSPKALAFPADGSGKVERGDVPEDLAVAAAEQRESMIETIAEADDSLVEKYLEGEELTDEELAGALKNGVLAGTFVPVICGSATGNMGVGVLMDLINDVLPSPLDRGPRQAMAKGEATEVAPDPGQPMSALVFKTLADPYAGRLSILRVFSGTLDAEAGAYNVNHETKEKFGQVLLIEGKNQKAVKSAGPGDVVAIPKLKETVTGDTLVDDKRKVRFEATEPLPPIMSFAIAAKTKGEEEKVFSSIARIAEEDPTLRLDRNEQTKEILLSGMGQVHLEATIEKAKRKFGVDVELLTPKVPYLETIKKKTTIANRHKKQSGGRGQFADVTIEIEPQSRGEGFEFVDKIVGGAIPRQFIPAVQKGVVDAMTTGVLAGCPVVDVKVTLFDGGFHPVDSSELAFKIAGSVGFKKGAAQCQPTLLEPIMDIAITVPEENVGDIMGDLNSRRGRVQGVDAKGKNQIVHARVPMAEVLHYAPDLTSMTGGRGSFTMSLDHYEEVPAHLQEKIIAAAQEEEG
ncbi:MAG: elongation factor G [Proteobacteria bacterium]|nr:elongation factor G [Pseudomonadota bacterium]